MTSGEYYGWLVLGISFGVFCLSMFGLALVWISQPPRR